MLVYGKNTYFFIQNFNNLYKKLWVQMFFIKDGFCNFIDIYLTGHTNLNYPENANLIVFNFIFKIQNTVCI